MTERQRERVDAAMRQGGFDGTADVADMRAAFDRLMGAAAVPEGVRTADVRLGGLPALEIVPEQPSGATLLYFHGGSFVLGSPRTALGTAAALVLRSGARGLSLDYRLAPEHPFPAAVEDALQAYRALLADGVPASTIALAGDSAGGSLAIALLLAARDAGLPAPSCAVVLSPSLDSTRSGASMTDREGRDPVFTREGLTAIGAHYRAGQDLLHPWLSPALTADLAALPPILLQVGSNEVLMDDSVRFAVRAAEADVDVVLDVTARVPHVFQAFQGSLDEADRALDRAGLFLRQHLAS